MLLMWFCEITKVDMDMGPNGHNQTARSGAGWRAWMKCHGLPRTATQKVAAYLTVGGFFVPSLCALIGKHPGWKHLRQSHQ